jgi:hypothetical protein
MAVDRYAVSLDNVVSVPKYEVNEGACSRGVVGVIPVYEEVHVSVDVGKHLPHDVALAGKRRPPDDGSFLGGNLSSPIRRVVVVDVDARPRKRVTKGSYDRAYGQLLVQAGHKNGSLWVSARMHDIEFRPDKSPS